MGLVPAPGAVGDLDRLVLIAVGPVRLHRCLPYAHYDVASGKGTLSFRADVQASAPAALACHVVVRDGDEVLTDELFPCAFGPGRSETQLALSKALAVQPWWPNGLVEQKLYNESHPAIACLAAVSARLAADKRFLATSSSGPSFSHDPALGGLGLHHDVHGPWMLPGTREDWKRHWDYHDALFISEVGVPSCSPVGILRRYAGDFDPWPPSIENPLWRYRTPWWIQWERYAKSEGFEAGREELARYVAVSQEEQAWALAYMAAGWPQGTAAASLPTLWRSDHLDGARPVPLPGKYLHCGFRWRAQAGGGGAESGLPKPGLARKAQSSTICSQRFKVACRRGRACFATRRRSGRFLMRRLSVDRDLLSLQGAQIVNQEGQPVILRGFGLGDWMNMERSITGYPANEEAQRQAVRQVLGDARIGGGPYPGITGGQYVDKEVLEETFTMISVVVINGFALHRNQSSTTSPGTRSKCHRLCVTRGTSYSSAMLAICRSRSLVLSPIRPRSALIRPNRFAAPSS